MQTGKEVILSWLNCRGMRDVLGGNQDPEYASWLQNVFPVDPVNGGPLVGRPAFQMTTGTPAGNGVACQLLYEYEQDGGTIILAGIFGGEIYSGNNGAWTLLVTSANLGTAGVTLSTTAKCYAVTYTGLMVISDGVNKPFTWDGTAGAGGLSLISNASGAWYGAPFVYYAKLGGIQAADRTTFEWSEENAPNTGYEAGGYTNAWTLTQNGSAPLTRILGTNNALYYWRTRGLGLVAGAMNGDFTTAGVHDAVSSEVGTVFPNSVLRFGTTLFFLDQFYRPWALPIGGGLVPLWQDISRHYVSLGGQGGSSTAYVHTFNDPSGAPVGFDDASAWERRWKIGAFGANTSVHRAATVYYPLLDQVVFFIAYGSSSDQSDHTVGVAFNPTTLRAQGYWTIEWGCTEVCTARKSGPLAENDPLILVAGGATYDGSAPLAVAYLVGQQGARDASGFITPDGLAPIGRVIGPKLGWDPARRWQFQELSWTVRQRSQATMYSYASRYFTSENPTLASAAAAQSFTRPSSSVADHRNTFGVGGIGRWLAPMCEVTSASAADSTEHNQPLIYGCTVRALPVGPEPAAR